MNITDTTRRFPRGLREAFPDLDATNAIGIDSPVVIETRPSLFQRVMRWLLNQR